MPRVEFIGKAKVGGQEYNKGNTLDVDEATKSRLLGEGVIKGEATSDCSELQAEVDDLENELLLAEKKTTSILTDLAAAKKIADYEAIEAKYKGGDTDEN